MSDIARKYLPIYVTDDIRELCSPATRDQQRVILLDRISNEHLMSTLLCWETIHQHSNEFESYIRLLSGLLNMIIPGSEIAIRGDCERIEQRLKSKCYSALREFYSLMARKTTGICLSKIVENECLCRRSVFCGRSVRWFQSISICERELEEEIKKRKTREEKLLKENEKLEQYVKRLEKTFLQWVHGTTEWRYMRELKTGLKKPCGSWNNLV